MLSQCRQRQQDTGWGSRLGSVARALTAGPWCSLRGSPGEQEARPGHQHPGHSQLRPCSQAQTSPLGQSSGHPRERGMAGPAICHCHREGAGRAWVMCSHRVPSYLQAQLCPQTVFLSPSWAQSSFTLSSGLCCGFAPAPESAPPRPTRHSAHLRVRGQPGSGAHALPAHLGIPATLWTHIE